MSDDSDKPICPAYYFTSIEKKYCQQIAYWLEIVANMTDMTHMQMVNELKLTYGMGHGHANAIVAYVRAR